MQNDPSYELILSGRSQQSSIYLLPFECGFFFFFFRPFQAQEYLTGFAQTIELEL